MVGANANTKTRGLSWFRPRGRTSSRVCVSTVLSCTGVLIEGGYKQGERGGESSKSLVVRMIEAKCNIVKGSASGGVGVIY
jgi:hypothetical protein